jgi:hypothetical protein
VGIIKRAGDLVYTFRFLKLLVTDFKDTEAYKLGIIDDNGKRLQRPDSAEERNAYTPFHRLVYNIKKLIPGGKIGSYASALYLIKEQYSVSEKAIQQGLNKCGIDHVELLAESSQWFVLDDGRLSPGSYNLSNDKEDLVRRKDTVIADEHCYPVGDIFGLNIYELTHRKTNMKVYAAVDELLI